MKRILVCFKVIRELEHLTLQEAEALCKGQDALRFFKRVFGAEDEAALENGLRIRDALEGDAELTAVTVGNLESRFAADLFAVGYDRVVEQKTACEQDFDSENTAKILYGFLQQERGYDLILAGQQASPEEAGLVPGLVAALGGFVYLSHVREIVPQGENWNISRYTAQGIEQITARGPLLLSVQDALHPYLRVPTLKQRMTVSGKKLETLPTATLGGEAASGLSLRCRQTRRTCRMLSETEEGAVLIHQLIQEGIE